MTLVEEYKSDSIIMRFYFGLDFDKTMTHNKNGDDGLMVCFVKDFEESKILYERDMRIDSIINNSISYNLDEIDNPYVTIYQTGEHQEAVFQVIREKLINIHTSPQWGISEKYIGNQEGNT
jgi:hypothetical protein